MNRSRFLAVVAAPLLIAAQAPPARELATTTAGTVEGRREGEVRVFRGIPFAAPPTGTLRWRPPQLVARWAGVRQADTFAPPCMQGVDGRQRSTDTRPNEDCLYLNVWSPATARPGARLPVLVWIHGGAFRAGATSDVRLAGDLLAAKGIVVVTIAYRLGAFGYLAHPALSAESAQHISGNYGLLDQLAALRWVQANIAQFGGDPEKVTLGGLSAGAISSAMLAAVPQARGTFRAIISMSGGSFAPPRYPTEAGENMARLADAERSGIAFAQGLGASDLSALRDLPAERILAADGRGVGWPVIDGRTIPDDEYRLFIRGQIADVPLLLGTTSDEGYNFSRITTLAAFRAEVTRRYGSFAPRILAAYPATTDAEAVRQARDLLRDVMFGWGTFVWADLQARYGRQRAWVYYFDHAPPHDPGIAADAGAIHGGDQPYPFGIAHQPQRAWTGRDHAISDEMMGYFVNFVTRGDPNGPGLPPWPSYRPKNGATLHVAETSVAGGAPNPDKHALIGAYMQARRASGVAGAP